MRVVGVVWEESLVAPFETYLRLGGLVDFHVTHLVEEVADLLTTSHVDVVVVSRHMARPVMSLVATLGSEDIARPKFALMTSAQNVSIVKLAGELEFDGVVDAYLEPAAVHQQLRNIALMRDDWADPIDSPASPGLLFLATRDAVDRSIIAHVALGLTDKQIASEIGFAPQTVRNRLSKIMVDAGLTNRTQLAHLWLREQSLAIRTAQTESATGEPL